MGGGLELGEFADPFMIDNNQHTAGDHTRYPFARQDALMNKSYPENTLLDARPISALENEFESYNDYTNFPEADPPALNMGPSLDSSYNHPAVNAPNFHPPHTAHDDFASSPNLQQQHLFSASTTPYTPYSRLDLPAIKTPVVDPVINVVAPEELSQTSQFQNESFPLYNAEGKPVEGSVSEFHHSSGGDSDSGRLISGDGSSLSGGHVSTPFGTPNSNTFAVPGTPLSIKTEISSDCSPLLTERFASPYDTKFDPFGDESLSPLIEDGPGVMYDPTDPYANGADAVPYPHLSNQSVYGTSPNEPQMFNDHFNANHLNANHLNANHLNANRHHTDHPNANHLNTDHTDHLNANHLHANHLHANHLNANHLNAPNHPYYDPPRHHTLQPSTHLLPIENPNVGSSLSVPRRKSRALSDSRTMRERAALLESLDHQSLLYQQKYGNRACTHSPVLQNHPNDAEPYPDLQFPAYSPINIVPHASAPTSNDPQLHQNGMLGVPTTRARSVSSPFEPTSDLKAAQMFSCELCGKRFTRAYNLRSHMRTHTDERPFACQHCGKAFARQHDRKRHEALHSGQKKFVCSGMAPGFQWGCQKRFARADALGRHFRTEAGKNCLRPLITEICANGSNRETAPEGILYSGAINNQPQLSFVDPDREPNSGMSVEEREDQTRRTVIITAVAEQLQDLLGNDTSKPNA